MSVVLEIVLVGYTSAILGFVWLTKDVTFATLARDPLFASCSIAVVIYVLGRFVLGLFYRPVPHRGYRPTVSVVVPAFNEERGVAGTIASCLSVDYPRELLEVIVVNDGSTDATWGRILEAKARWPELYVVDLGRNYGKCGAMAEGIRRARGEVLCFEDSDSYLEPGRPRDERWRPPGGRASTPARRVSTVREDTCWEVSVQVLMSQSTSGQRHRRLFHNRRAGRPKQARARTSTAMRS